MVDGTLRQTLRQSLITLVAFINAVLVVAVVVAVFGCVALTAAAVYLFEADATTEGQARAS
jgi:hypothetical protein